MEDRRKREELKLRNEGESQFQAAFEEIETTILEAA